ncbi:BQ2448_187 [Microbotryum intermedium]|uniref:BQ2448_187 protein n=1 Tax=Microbotryum intermedium TaxID=269621 RepID=A0A238FAF5_9BASI|nr:BQ2448_187 [Microbotryum intermedium]
MSWGHRPPAGSTYDPRQNAFSEIFSRPGQAKMASSGGYGQPQQQQQHHQPTSSTSIASSSLSPYYYPATHDDFGSPIASSSRHYGASTHAYPAPPLPPPGAAATRRSMGGAGSAPATGLASRSSVINPVYATTSTSVLPSPTSSAPVRPTPQYPGNPSELLSGYAHAHPHQQLYGIALDPPRNSPYHQAAGPSSASSVESQNGWLQRPQPNSSLHLNSYGSASLDTRASAPSPSPSLHGAGATSIRSGYNAGRITPQTSGPSTASTSAYDIPTVRRAHPPYAPPAGGTGARRLSSGPPVSDFPPTATSVTPPSGYGNGVFSAAPRLPTIIQDDFVGLDASRAYGEGGGQAPTADLPGWVSSEEVVGDASSSSMYYLADRQSPASTLDSAHTYDDDEPLGAPSAHPSNYSTYESSVYNGSTVEYPRRSSGESDRISMHYGHTPEARSPSQSGPTHKALDHLQLGINGAVHPPTASLALRRSSESMRMTPLQPKVDPHQDRSRSFSGETVGVRRTELANPHMRPSSMFSMQSAQDFAPRRAPVVYPALLSRVAEAFKARITLSERVKDGLVYPATFDGRDAVDKIAYIIRTSDRNLALLLGRALDAQKLFHDVTYDHRLRDSPLELYQFRERLALPFIKPDDLMLQHDGRSAVPRPGSIAETTASNEESVPSGVFTLLTDCYSPTCTRDRLCYSIACPRRLEQQARLNLKIKPGLQRSVSSESLGDLREPGSLWIHSVPQEVADATSDTEKKRQEALNEVFYTERDFVRDLEYLRDRWIKPLRTLNIIPEGRREEFVTQVFWNVLEIHSVSVRLAELLNKRQKQAELVHHIGDIFLELVPHFGPFVKYGAHQLYGKYEFEKEKGSNPAFAKFVDETERFPESRKLELNAYLTKPTTRLARYPLLLEACLKHTPDDNPDKANLPKVVKLVREFLGKVNIESGKSENRFNLAQLDQQLVFKHGEAVDLRLRDEDRELIFKGPLKKRGGTQSDSAELQVFLFDHAVLMVKQKSKNEQYKVYRKPIPLELLVVAPIDDSTSGRTGAVRPKSLMARGTSTKYPLQPPPGVEKNSKQGFAMTFIHLGRRGYQITVWAASWAGRKKWLEKIEARQNQLKDRSLVFETLPLTSGYFVGTNRLICAAPFERYIASCSNADNGNRMVYGTENGVYLSDLRDVNKAPLKVISVPNVTQLDVLEEQGILIVLADKAVQTFFVDHLDPGDAIGAAKRARKISSHATFFKAGQCLGRTLVCVVKSGSVSSTIKTLEPIDQVRGKKQPALRKFLQGSNESLRVFKEFYIPNESSSVHFLKSKLCVGCTKGFEIVDLETLDTQGLLDPADSSLDFVQKREMARPIAIYRIDGEFLLCYDEFAFYVNKNGWRAKSNWIIQWEGFPTHFAMHYPYVLAFEPTFIEVRHVESGALMQIIPGNNIRCLYAETPPSLSSNSAYYTPVNNSFGFGRYPAAGSPSRNESECTKLTHEPVHEAPMLLAH